MATLSLSSIAVGLLSFVIMAIVFEYMDRPSDVIDKNGSQESDLVEEKIEVPSVFSFSQCGDRPKSLPIQIKKFSINPDPLILPGILKFKVSLRVKEEITGPIRANLLLEKHTSDGWSALPCNDDGYGSCEYPDVCPSLANVDSFCPKEVKEKGQNCLCPLQPGKYSFKTLKVPVHSGLVEGPFHMVAKFKSENGTTLACLDSTIILGTAGK